MTPLKQLYENYSDYNPVNAGLRAYYSILEKDINYTAFAENLSCDVEYEREQAFNAGFRTAVQLLMGGGTV